MYGIYLFFVAKLDGYRLGLRGQCTQQRHLGRDLPETRQIQPRDAAGLPTPPPAAAHGHLPGQRGVRERQPVPHLRDGQHVSKVLRELPRRVSDVRHLPDR